MSVPSPINYIGSKSRLATQIVEHFPLGRFAAPSDVAQAAMYLATADFITGIELCVDGGRTI
jgi:3-oxoacyl-[acyl-carrier protein] reductase